VVFYVCVRVSYHKRDASESALRNICSYPWEQVVQAAYRKYPNPHNPSVVATDVVERKVFGGKILTKRLLATSWNVPFLVTKVVLPLPVMELLRLLCR